MSDTVVLTYKYRLLPSRSQHRRLEEILEEQRVLYNAALSERIDCYRKTGKSLSFSDQCKGLAEWRTIDATASLLASRAQRWTLRRIDEAYKAFFRRLRSKEGKAGFPRYRGKKGWDTFGFSEFCGIEIKNRRVYFKGLVGGMRVHLHRPIPGEPLSCVFTKDDKGWNIGLHVRIKCASRRDCGLSIGIDVGLSSLATLSDGQTIPNARVAKKAEQELRRRSRALARRKRDSKRRAKQAMNVSRLHRKIANTRSTYLHQVSSRLVRNSRFIAIEKLNVKGLAASMLAKSVHDVSWGIFRRLLVYKAEKAGCELVEVDPRFTTQKCSGCGTLVPKTLSCRIHRCECGVVLGRDHNAALNILHLGVVAQEAVNVARYSERPLRNVA